MWRDEPPNGRDRKLVIMNLFSSEDDDDGRDDYEDNNDDEGDVYAVPSISSLSSSRASSHIGGVECRMGMRGWIFLPPLFIPFPFWDESQHHNHIDFLSPLAAQRS